MPQQTTVTKSIVTDAVGFVGVLVILTVAAGLFNVSKKIFYSAV